MSEPREEDALETGAGGVDQVVGGLRPGTAGDSGRRWRFDDAVHAARHLSSRTG